MAGGAEYQHGGAMVMVVSGDGEEEVIKNTLLRRVMADMSETSPGSQRCVKITCPMMKRDSSLCPPSTMTQTERQTGKLTDRQTDSC